jgi:hypothetical protein
MGFRRLLFNLVLVRYCCQSLFPQYGVSAKFNAPGWLAGELGQKLTSRELHVCVA